MYFGSFQGNYDTFTPNQIKKKTVEGRQEKINL